LENATRHEVPKYIATAHKLLAEIAAGRGQLAEAEAELSAALDQLRNHSVPILAWKTYAALGRLYRRRNDDQSARAAFGQSADIIDTIAAGLDDERLKATFLNSEAVCEVLKGVGRGL
jgi:tetratricopeptide (TPR) repeat protein